MNNEAQVKAIRNFIYNLSPGVENYAQANRELRTVLQSKVDKKFTEEFEKIKNSFKNNK